MKISYNLLQLPPFVLLVACMLLFALVGGLGTYLFKKVRIKYARSHNEIVGYVFVILGGFYALLLGFVVLFVWDALNQAQNNADREGSLAMGLYRNIKYFPDSNQVKPLMNSYLIYVHSVAEQEYPAMEQMKELNGLNRKSFNGVFKQMEKIESKDPRVDQMLRQLNELATYRALRQMSYASEIPSEIWVPLFLGAFIILFCSMLVHMESIRIHILVNTLLAAFIGLVIYIIITIDHPFTGSMRIKADEYMIILKMVKEDV
jgi:hypothetical protein